MKLGDLGMAVTHNSPYLLKRADGSFIDPETGERLGFDHRFMASGEGCQAHGWGSYFSENDRRNYANNQRNPNKYKGVTSDEIDKLNLERTERVIAMCILGDMDLYPQRTVEELIQEYIRDIKINTALVEKKLALLLKIKNIGDDSVKYWNKSVERQKLCEKIDKILGDSEAGRNVYMNIASSLRYDRMAFSRIINEYETTCDSVCVENEEELAAFERLNPDDFERGEKERHHYEVEIPDNDGTNYIEEQKTLTDKQIQMVLDGLSRWKVIDVRTNDWLKPYTNPDGKPYSYLRGGNWKGENLYKEFCAAFDYEHNYRDMKPADAGRRASQFLHDCGFVGIHYSSYSDGECYVIFDEADAKIVNHELFGLSGDAPRFNVGDWIEYFPLVAEAKRGKYKGKLWVHNITAVGDTFYTVDSWCVQTHQPRRNRQMTISGQQEWYRKIAQPKWTTDHDRRLRLAKAKAKALKLKLELMKMDGLGLSLQGVGSTDTYKLYLKLLNDSNYYDVDYNPTNGGLKAIHVGHNLDKKGGAYEKHVMEAGFAAGHSVILEDERGFDNRHTEGTWDGLLFEVAGRETATANNVFDGLKHCAEKKTTKVAILDYPNGGFDVAILDRAIRRYNGLKKLEDGQYIKYDKIVCVQNKLIVAEISNP